MVDPREKSYPMQCGLAHKFSGELRSCTQAPAALPSRRQRLAWTGHNGAKCDVGGGGMLDEIMLIFGRVDAVGIRMLDTDASSYT